MIKTYRPLTKHNDLFIETNISATLSTRCHFGSGGDGALIVYIIDANSSNSMKSSNPHSGIHETETVKCLDTTCLNPACNQGGVVVVGLCTREPPER